MARPVTLVTVLVPGPLRDLADGQAKLQIFAVADPGHPYPNLRAALDALARHHPLLERRIRDERGEIRRHVSVYVAGVNVRDGHGLDQPVPDGVEVYVLPAVSGD